MPKLLSDRLPNPPAQYNQQQFNQLVRKIQQALSKDVEMQESAEDREALDFFLSN